MGVPYSIQYRNGQARNLPVNFGASVEGGLCCYQRLYRLQALLIASAYALVSVMRSQSGRVATFSSTTTTTTTTTTLLSAVAASRSLVQSYASLDFDCPVTEVRKTETRTIRSVTTASSSPSGIALAPVGHRTAAMPRSTTSTTTTATTGTSRPLSIPKSLHATSSATASSGGHAVRKAATSVTHAVDSASALPRPLTGARRTGVRAT
jgi:hypothetical protein